MKRFAAFVVLFFVFVAPHFTPQAYALTPSDDSDVFIQAVDDCTTKDCTNKQWYWTDSVNASAQYIIASVGLKSSQIAESPFYYKKTAISVVNNIVIAMYTSPPADLALWVRETGQTLGFIPKSVMAQGRGVGFSGLSAILPVWRAFRDISYSIIAVIMLVIGFMVMFRRKIDPKTVVTVQNALPRIVFALLLVTFSYAIAAFFIDLMYVAMAIAVNLIVNANPGVFHADTAAQYISGNLGTVASALASGGWSSVDEVIKLLWGNNTTGFWGIVFDPLLFPKITMGVLLTAVIAVAILIAIIRIAFMLVTAYIQIIFSVLISPFMLMTEALPGSSGFSSWAKNLFANLSVFPVTAALLLIGNLLTKANPGTVWTPPLLSGGGTSAVTGLIGIGILLTIPNIVHTIKEALKTKSIFGVGGAFGPAGGITMQGLSLVSMVTGMKSSGEQREQMKLLSQQIASGQKGISGTATDAMSKSAEEPRG